MARMTVKKQGNMVEFLSAGEADIRDCKIYFEPEKTEEGISAPRDEIYFYHTNNNLMPRNEPSFKFGGVINGTGSSTIAAATVYSCFVIYVGKNVYIRHQRTVRSQGLYIAFCDEPYRSRIDATIYGAVNTQNRPTFTFNSGEHPYLVICYNKSNLINNAYDLSKEMLSFGGGDKPYEPRIKNPYTRVAFPNSIYGGYVDLINGEIVEEWGHIESYSGETISEPWISSLDEYETGVTPSEGAEVVYKLTEPIHHQISPMELKTLNGHNRIWSNGGTVAVEYDLIETQKMIDIRKRVFSDSGQLHIENISATNEIINFNTAYSRPLEKCVLSFNPMQSSSGTLYGYDILSFALTGKNKFPAETPFGHFRPDDGIVSGSSSFNSWIIPVPYGDNVYIRLPVTKLLSYSFFTEAKPVYKAPYYNNVTMTNRSSYGYTNLDVMNRRLTLSTTKDITTPSEFWDTLNYYVSIDFNSSSIVNSERPQGRTYDIILPQTMYGGYVDVLTGELVKTWETKLGSELSWSIVNTVETMDVFRATNMIGKKYNLGLNNLCDSYEVISAGISTIIMDDKTCKGNHSGVGYSNYYYVRDSDFANNLEGFIEHIADVRFVYELATPVHYSLEPQVLKTLQGVNNIWSNANGDLEISYYTH